jgi:hypothetical protein
MFQPVTGVLTLKLSKITAQLNKPESLITFVEDRLDMTPLQFGFDKNSQKLG